VGQELFPTSKVETLEVIPTLENPKLIFLFQHLIVGRQSWGSHGQPNRSQSGVEALAVWECEWHVNLPFAFAQFGDCS
jgi:hypothetical protein